MLAINSMVWTIAAREMLDNLMSLKFLFGTVLCLFLVIISIIVSMQDYQNRMDDYESAVADFGQSLYNNIFHPRLYRKPEILSIFARGLDKHFGNVVEMSSWSVPVLAGGFMGAPESLQFSGEFASIDFLFVVRVVLSLLAIFLSYDAISGEHERGTLKLVLSRPVPRASVILGKLIAGTICLLIPVVMSFILGILIAHLIGGIHFAAEDWLRIFLIVGVTILCVISFYMLGLAVSSRTRQAATSLLILLLIWVTGVFLIPGVAKAAMGRYRLMTPQPGENIAAIRSDFFKRAKADSMPDRRRDPEAYIRYETKWYKLRNEMEHSVWSSRSSYLNRLYSQADLVQWICRLSPSECCLYAAQAMARTDTGAYRKFMNHVRSYSELHWKFRREFDKSRYEPKGQELVAAQKEKYSKAAYAPAIRFSTSFRTAAPDICLLVIFSVMFFMLSFLFFTRYDVH